MLFSDFHFLVYWIFIFWYTGSDKWGKQASGVGK